MNIANKIKQYFLLTNFVLNFNKFKFWSNFFLLIIFTLSLLIMLSMFGLNVVGSILNPLQTSKHNIIVEIYPESTQQKTKEKTNLVLDIITKNKLIDTYSIIEEANIVDIFKSFSGDYKNNTYDIPFPVIINVKFKDASNVAEEIDNFRFNLSQKVKDVYVDSENELISRLVRPVKTTKYMFFMLPAIIFTVLIFILAAIIYAIVFSNQKTIKILMLLGLKNYKLALEFANWLLIKTLLAAALSFTISSMVVLVFAYLNSDIISIVSNILSFLIILSILPCINFALGFIFAIKIIKIAT